MRERQPCTVLAFHTTTEAMEAEKKCNENHIPGRLIPTPREITAGCGLAWKMGTVEYREYRTQMDQLHITYQKIAELNL